MNLKKNFKMLMITRLLVGCMPLIMAVAIIIKMSELMHPIKSFLFQTR
jgi:hypothetical protein